MTNVYAGVELGGTKCVILLARGPNEILAREQIPTRESGETLRAIEDVIANWRASHRFGRLGIASFGPLDLNRASPCYGDVKTTPKRGWSGARILKRLQAAAGVPAVIDTDVNGAALAEMQWGSGRGKEDFAYITVGTGVGVGLIVNGKPTRGFAHCELGHIRPARLPGDDWAGSCPFHGDCIEGLASGPAIEARLGTSPLHLSPVDPAWRTVAWPLAQLCHAIVCAAAPQAIAIGGGVVEGNPQLLEMIDCMLVESLAGYLKLPAGVDYVCAPELGKNAGPLGAIALAMRNQEQAPVSAHAPL